MVRGLPDRCDHSRSRDGGVRTHAKEIWWQLARRALDAWMGVICRRSARTSRGRWQGTGGRGELPRTQPPSRLGRYAGTAAALGGAAPGILEPFARSDGSRGARVADEQADTIQRSGNPARMG